MCNNVPRKVNLPQTEFLSLQLFFAYLVHGRPRSLLVLINPRSGNFKANEIYNTSVAPLMELVELKVDRVGMVSFCNKLHILHG